MPKPPDLPVSDLDDGTWHQPAQSDPTNPPQETPLPDTNPISAQDLITPRVDTPPPAGPRGNKDSAEFDGLTPRPGSNQSAEWDLLPPPLIEKGQVILGKYALQQKIGEGGMGEVWLVENIQLERQSALKLIKPEIAQNNKGWSRFEREARLMAKLTHPNAVAVYDFKRTHSIGYIEMEFVRGCSLDRYLADFKGQPMTLAWTAQILDQLCSLLQEAHGYTDEKRGRVTPIIHRDLKPSNLMLVDKKPPGQNLKVLDFGIAKMIEEEGSPELTGAGDLVGTPAYMSPEQIRGGTTSEGKGDIDGRSDLYSVGVLLYQLLTGYLPFKGMSKMAVLAAHLNSKPPPMKEANRNARVPEQVERVVMSCLEKDPALRPRTAHELAEKFRAAVGGDETAVQGPKSPLAVPLIAVSCVLFAVVGWVGLRSFKSGNPPNDTGLSTKGGAGSTSVDNGEDVKQPPIIREPIASKSEIPGYEAFSADKLEKIGKSSLEHVSSDLGDAPAVVKRESDGAIFYCFRRGIYLPLGYKPEDPKDLDGFWPKTLVRESDGVKFIWISGGSYDRGDFSTPKAQPPALDLRDNPLQLHKVTVSGFYIQETEVTNKEIMDFQRDHPDVPLERWKETIGYFEDQKRPRIEVLTYPAVCINRTNCQKFAVSVGGRLPTEAEWEYAARSGGHDCLWAGKNQVIKKSQPKAQLSSPVNAGELFAMVPVRTFEEDQTDQNVFDMTGNVREWCLDVYKPYLDIISENKNKPLHDFREGGEPEKADSMTQYVVRGGSFATLPMDARTFQRNAVEASGELLDVGFRVVIECPPEK